MANRCQVWFTVYMNIEWNRLKTPPYPHTELFAYLA